MSARSVPPKHHSPEQRRNAAHVVLRFRACIETLYRAYTARCILIQGSIDSDQFSFLTTSFPGLWPFPRVLLFSIPYTDIGESTFHALWCIRKRKTAEVSEDPYISSTLTLALSAKVAQDVPQRLFTSWKSRLPDRDNTRQKEERWRPSRKPTGRRKLSESLIPTWRA